MTRCDEKLRIAARPCPRAGEDNLSAGWSGHRNIQTVPTELSGDGPTAFNFPMMSLQKLSAIRERYLHDAGPDIGRCGYCQVTCRDSRVRGQGLVPGFHENLQHASNPVATHPSPSPSLLPVPASDLRPPCVSRGREASLEVWLRPMLLRMACRNCRLQSRVRLPRSAGLA